MLRSLAYKFVRRHAVREGDICNRTAGRGSSRRWLPSAMLKASSLGGFRAWHVLGHHLFHIDLKLLTNIFLDYRMIACTVSVYCVLYSLVFTVDIYYIYYKYIYGVPCMWYRFFFFYFNLFFRFALISFHVWATAPEKKRITPYDISRWFNIDNCGDQTLFFVGKFSFGY